VSKIKLYILAFLSLTTISLTLSPAVLAVSNPVEFVVPDTTLTVRGQAAPGALVSIYDGNTLIGTTVANSNANFTKKFVALRSGLHNLKIEYVDKSGRKSTTVNDTVSLAFHKETAVEYFLPPTFEIIPTSVTEGGQVSFQGSTVPGAQVTVVIDGGNTVLRPQADSNGNYSVSLGTDGYFFGQHPVNVKAKFAGNNSYESEKKPFNVLPKPTESKTENQQNNLDPPIIISPESPHKTDNERLLIKGTAAPNQQIIIFIDGEPVGSTFTDSEGVWFFNLSIYSNRHEIKAITCVKSECSEFSNNLEVTFTGEFGKCADFRFVLADYRFWGVHPNEGVNLEFSQLSGEPKYTMIIDWGDQITEKFDHSDQDGFNVQHVYRQVGQFNGSVTIADNRDCIFVRSFSVDVLPKDTKLIDFWWTIPAALTTGFALLLRYKNPS